MQQDRSRFWTAARIVLTLVLAKLLFHLLTFRGYGIFRDELYYLVCSRHLAFGYVEFPPLIAILTRAVTSILGESLFAVRLLPMLAGAALVALAASIARESTRCSGEAAHGSPSAHSKPAIPALGCGLAP